MFANLMIERMCEESKPILEHDHGRQRSYVEEGVARSRCGCFNIKDGIVGSVRMGFRHVSKAMSRRRVKGLFYEMFRRRNRGEKTKRNMGFAYDPQSYALNFDHVSDDECDAARRR